MTFIYCAEAVDLSDAEILALVRGLCRKDSQVEDLNLLRLAAVCDLAKDHPSLHASFQAETQQGEITWFRWRGQLRDVTHGIDGDCPVTGDDVRVGCLLFKGHPGPHCCLAAEDESPSWCGR